MKPPTIDPEFEGFLPPLPKEAYSDLRDKILEEGMAENIVVWQEENVIIDGHHRFRICTELDVPFGIRYESFENREQVLEWMVKNQLGKRNLNERQLAYFRGKHYQSVKQPHGGARGHGEPLLGKTAETIAKTHGVAPNTIKRDAKFAEAVDKVAKETQQAPHDIINGDASRKKIIEEAFVPKPKAAKPPKNGRETYNWQEVEGWFGQIVQSIDKAAKAYPKQGNLNEQDDARLLAADFLKTWRRYKTSVTGAK